MQVPSRQAFSCQVQVHRGATAKRRRLCCPLYIYIYNVAQRIFAQRLVAQDYQVTGVSIRAEKSDF